MATDYNAGTGGPISSLPWLRAAAVIPLVTIGLNTAGQMEVKDFQLLEQDQNSHTRVLTAAETYAATRTVSGGQPPAKAVLAAFERQANAHGITNAEWRKHLTNAARWLIGTGYSRSQIWAIKGESNHGAQCAFGQAVIFDRATQTAHIANFVNIPDVSSYGESNPHLPWRVEGQGSWTEWAQANGRWHPGPVVNGRAADGYKIQDGDLGSYGGHIVMLHPSSNGLYHWGVDDGYDLGDHFGPAHSGFVGVINMDLPKGWAASAPAPAHRNTQGSTQRNRAPAQVQSPAPASSAPDTTTAADVPSTPGDLAAPGLGGTTLSTSATPATTTAVVAGGIAAPGFVAGTVGHADQFQADQPQQQAKPAAKAPAKRAPKPPAARPRYSRHNPPPQVRASIPGTAAQQAFIRLVAPGAIAAQQRYGVPAAVTIAQAIDESGWGQSGLAARDHNLYGIKGTGPAGSDMLPTQEYQNGRYVTITAPFRVYNNVGQSTMDHGQLLATYSPYRHAMTLRHNPDAFAQALTGVYATNPHYGSDLIASMHLFNLYQFDSAHASSAAQSHQAAPRPRPVPAPRRNPVPGANLGGGTQAPSPAQPGPGGLLMPVGPVVEAPPQPAVAGGLSAPGFAGSTNLASDVSGAGDGGVQLVADVTPAPPWRTSSGSHPAQSDASAPGAAPPWRTGSAPSAAAPPPVTRRHMPPRPVPAPRSATPAVELVAYRQPAPQPVQSATTLKLVGSTGLDPKYGNRHINKFKADVNANRAHYEQVSAMTGVPWEIVAALDLAGRFDGSQGFSLAQLATLFRQRAMAAGVDITRGISPAQLDAAFRAYALGAKLKKDGLTPAQLAQLIKAPLNGAQTA